MKSVKLIQGLMIVSITFALSFSDLTAQNANRQGGRNASIPLTQTELNDFEKEHLVYMREEEKLARDTYLALYEQWQDRIFQNIAASEQRHTNQIAGLLTQFGLEDPYQTEPGAFNNQDLQSLYNALIETGKTSLTDAYTVGATIEDLDIHDINSALPQVENESVLRVYQNLLTGSENHMRAFYSLLEKQGMEYEAQYISQDKLEEIIAATSGGKRGKGRQLGSGSDSKTGSKGRTRLNSDCSGTGIPKLSAKNFPNPGNPSTTISYTLQEAANVTVRIFNAAGREIQAIQSGQQSAGTYQLTWDATDASGNSMSSGVYFYRVQAGNEAVTRRFTLIK